MGGGRSGGVVDFILQDDIARDRVSHNGPYDVWARPGVVGLLLVFEAAGGADEVRLWIDEIQRRSRRSSMTMAEAFVEAAQLAFLDRRCPASTRRRGLRRGAFGNPPTS